MSSGDMFNLIRNEAGEVDPRFVAVIQTVCAGVNYIYSVDRDTKMVTSIRQDGEAKGLKSGLEKTVSYADGIGAYIEHNVYVGDRAELYRQMEIDRLFRRLEKESSFSIFYRVDRGGELQYYRVKCIRFGAADSFKTLLLAFMPEDFDTSQSQIIHTLETDELTGVYTKQAFYHRAAEILAENPEKDYDLIIADVENFKLVNRIYGRSGGDEVLKYMARFYTIGARGGICARYGADQFVLLFESLSDEELPIFRAMIERLRTDAPVPYLSFRYGLYQKVDREDTVADMCDKANLALRSKKNYFDDSIMLYDSEVIQENYRTRLYESDFERALGAKEFVVWCQPKYNSFTKRMTSAEALVRWKTAEGFISPGQFIPIFESSGLIARLDEYVFRYVCERQKQLIDAGTEPLPVSVNLSRATLFRPHAVECYRQIIEEIGVPKKYVPLELTESATVEGTQISNLVNQLKEAGFVLHLDDFGSGYSSLSSLTTFRFDCLKLDKSLVDGIGNARSDELLRHMIELAHGFQMEVVAEGVELREQYNFLRKLSCDTIQGYFFCKPVPFDDYLLMAASQPDEEFDTVDSGILADEASVGSLRITNELKLQYLSALAGIYMTMHVIDLKEDTVVEFATTTNVKAHANRAHDAVGQMVATMTNTVDPDYVPACLEFTDLTTVQARMKGKRTIAAEFVGKHFGWFQTRFVTVTTNENDEPEKLIFTTRVIEADLRKESSVVSVCLTDELTGVSNLTAFEQDLRALDASDDPADADLAIVVADINGLKGINDTLGHTAGDELLWGMADTLNTVLGKPSRVYRLEADHFVGIFHADSGELETIREKYEDAVRNWMGNEVRSLSTTFGMASRSELGTVTATALVEEANRRWNARKKAEEN